MTVMGRVEVVQVLQWAVDGGGFEDAAQTEAAAKSALHYLRADANRQLPEVAKLVISWAHAHRDEMPSAFLPLLVNLKAALDADPGADARYALDALRRTTELLAGIQPENASDYWHEERDYIIAVNQRLLRDRDPDGSTDRSVR